VTEALERAFKEAQALPGQEQLEIAEMRWNKLLTQPQSEVMLRAMAIEAIAEDDAGLTRESGETW
jgi:hypothetical protein